MAEQLSRDEGASFWRTSSLFSIAVIILVAALLLDSLLSDVSTYINRDLSESERVALFSTIVGITVVMGTFVIRKDTNKVKYELGSRNNVLPLISGSVAVVQYVIVGLLVLIALQSIFSSQYYNIFLIISLVLSWIVAVGLMGLMSFKFLQWYRSEKGKLVLVYLIFSLMFCPIQLGISIPTFFIIAQSAPFSVNAQTTEVKPFQANTLDLSTLFAVVSAANWFIIPMSYVVWVATALMLYYNSPKFGRAKYWLMLGAPLAGLVIGNVALLVFVPSVNTVFDQQVILYTMILFGGLLSNGLLLAFAFRMVSRNVRDRSSKLSDYLAISSRGIAILLVAFYGNVSAGSYMPFGIVANSFLHFGAFLFFAGVYASTISVSFDLNLRTMIRKKAPGLFDKMGTAEMTRELETEVKKHQEKLKERTGIESSMSDTEIKDYIEFAARASAKKQEKLSVEEEVDSSSSSSEKNPEYSVDDKEKTS
jgi:hypothetical protein